ncbi:xanthine dehydrogenase family protein molybdopterin-binding subunit [Streptomyces boninensis]|uniref:xanthine dehydrogenase family protein molybdopterin-binding subunit n=1 Tax=Streptomyces boninensis TaxID=2039455 RepID=UPI003B21CA5B
MTIIETPGLRRPDGPLKLTGSAGYAADTTPAGTAHAAFVGATVPHGRVAAIDADAARRAPGVAAVLTHGDLPDLSGAQLAQSWVPLTDDRVRHEGQPLAIVLAETLEQARHAATLVHVEYAGIRPAAAFADAEDAVEATPFLSPTDESTGDVDAALAAADTVLTRTYTTADRHHNPIEPSSTLAAWESADRLTVHDSSQGISSTQAMLATAFGLPTENVRVICPYIGGGFGCKGYPWPHQVLIAAAAKVAGRPVKLSLTRAEMFTSCGHQPTTLQTITLAAAADGRLGALRHHSANASSRDDDYPELVTEASGHLYAADAIELRRRVRHLDRPQPTPMRAPGAGMGMFALESAMDELAGELGIDPVELRLRNEPERDPLNGRPFSSRKLRECLVEGARRFGWAEARQAEPRARKAGDALVGHGMAVSFMPTFRFPSSARVRIGADGTVTVASGTQEMGTGLPGVMTAIAAEALGVDPGVIEVSLGDTELPPAGMTAGSSSTMGVGSAVHLAATELRKKLEALEARSGPAAGGPAGLLRSAGADSLEAEATWAPEEDAGPGGSPAGYSTGVHGAVFAEVRVDEDLGLVRLERALAVYAAGRIINPLAARSQMTGGIVWGLGQALLEHSDFDPGLGRFRSKNLAGYVIPGNADVPAIDVHFLDDHDEHASPLGAKGIGEMGPVGVSAAIANAVFNATGVRVRDLPIGIADVLRGD